MARLMVFDGTENWPQKADPLDCQWSASASSTACVITSIPSSNGSASFTISGTIIMPMSNMSQTVVVRGSGSLLQVDGISQGNSQERLFIVDQGASMVVNNYAVILASDQVEARGLRIDGPGSSVSIGGELRLFQISGAANFPGQTVVRNGGSLHVGGNVIIASSEVGVASQLYVRSGGVATVDGAILVSATSVGDGGNLVAVDGDIVAAQGIREGDLNESDRIILSGAASMTGASISGSPAAMVVDGGVITCTSVETGPAAKIYGLGGTIAAPVLHRGAFDFQLYDSNFRLAIDGALQLESTSSFKATVQSSVSGNDQVLVDVDGPATLKGSLLVLVESGWWNGPRRPIDLVRAQSIIGGFTSIAPLPTGPDGTPLEIVATSQRVRLQINVPSDLNNDGWINAIDLAILLGQWGGPGQADLNGNGVVNGADLNILLSKWNGIFAPFTNGKIERQAT